jgi:hypothetical protein
MTKVFVKSSVLHCVAYIPSTLDHTRGTLRVWFNTRSVYDYLDVPHTVYAYLVCAPSKGVVYNALIKGTYRSVRRIGYRVRRSTTGGFTHDV